MYLVSAWTFVVHIACLYTCDLVAAVPYGAPTEFRGNVDRCNANMGGGRPRASLTLPLVDGCVVECGALDGLSAGNYLSIRRLLNVDEGSECTATDLVVRVPLAVAINVATVNQLQMLARVHNVGGGYRTQSAVREALESHVCVVGCPPIRFLCSRSERRAVSRYRRTEFRFFRTL